MSAQNPLDIPDDEDMDDLELDADAGEEAEEDFEDEGHPVDGTNEIEGPSLRHLKDISSLASWTVSSYKPGCGVPALRHPSPEYFWQSDGPQPHYLNIHFFKMVSICHIRLYLDSELDESYTPTKIQFHAGTGHHDLQLVCEMTFDTPKGWITVDLSNAGGPPAFEEDGEDSDEEDEVGADAATRTRRTERAGRGPTLRCFIVQVKILENHQNGKDTHLRGLQLFARDDAAGKKNRRLTPAMMAPLKAGLKPGQSKMEPMLGLREASWMAEPTLR